MHNRSEDAMLSPSDIDQIEAKLADHGKSVADLCREADIAQTTWWRWKSGAFFPSYRKARKVEAAVAALTGAGQAAE